VTITRSQKDLRVQLLIVVLVKASQSYPELQKASQSYPELRKASQSYPELRKASQSHPELQFPNATQTPQSIQIPAATVAVKSTGRTGLSYGTLGLIEMPDTRRETNAIRKTRHLPS
jgi:hypothetical protein